MCGLVCAVSKNSYGFNFKEVKVFDELLYCDAVRGDDSTGAFGIDRLNGDVTLIKQAGNSGLFQATPEYQEFSRKGLSKFHTMVGHNRAATRGAASDENAHPFHEGKIILVHNGTLNNHRKLADVEVDSHAVCHAFNELGYEEALHQIDGAYCFIWYDLEDNKLRIIRNDKRPLFMAETSSAFFFTSEVWLLYGILGRNDQAPIGKIHAITADTIYEIDLENRSAGFTETAFKKREVKPAFVAKQLPVKVHEKKEEAKKDEPKVEGGAAGYRPKLDTNPKELSDKYLGQSVVFSVYDFKLIDHKFSPNWKDSVLLYGVRWEDTECIEVRAYISEDEWEVFNSEWEVFRGRVTRTYMKEEKDGKRSIHLVMDAGDVKPASVPTANGKTLSYLQWKELGNDPCCSKCSTIIDHSWIPDTTFRYRRGNIRIICADCRTAAQPLGVNKVEDQHSSV